MKKVIAHAYVATVDDHNTVYPDGTVVMENGLIQWVGPSKEYERNTNEHDQQYDMRGKLVIPGLVNAHTHNVYYLMRGLGMDLELKSWLKKAIWPGLLRIGKHEAYLGSLLGNLENLRSGVTCVADNYYMPKYKKENIDGVLQAARDVGLRFLMARGFHDFAFNIPEEFVESEDEIRQEYLRLIDVWHDPEHLFQMAISPVNILYNRLETVANIGAIALEHGLPIHTHVAEARFEVEEIRRRHGKTYMELFDQMGLVNTKFHAVHSVFLEEVDMKILAQNGGTAIFNPASNLLLASGVAPIEEMKKHGVHIALGTDAPNNNQDLLESMKLACILPRITHYNPLAMTSKEVLRMATIQGARAMGIADCVGSLEVGKRADITVVNMETLHNSPVHDPVANLVYSANQSDVVAVFIDGEPKVMDGSIVGWDVSDVIRDVGDAVRSLFPA